MAAVRAWAAENGAKGGKAKARGKAAKAYMDWTSWDTTSWGSEELYDNQYDYGQLRSFDTTYGRTLAVLAHAPIAISD